MITLWKAPKTLDNCLTNTVLPTWTNIGYMMKILIIFWMIEDKLVTLSKNTFNWLLPFLPIKSTVLTGSTLKNTEFMFLEHLIANKNILSFTFSSNSFLICCRGPFNRIASKSFAVRAKTVIAQRKMQSAAQSREANMAVVLVCTVIMFIICHSPRMILNR